MVLVTGDLPAQHIECILREEALTGDKRFIIVLHTRQTYMYCVRCTATMYILMLQVYFIQHGAWRACTYILCKWQKLHRRTISPFVGFYHNVGKFFAILLLTNMKTICQIFIGTVPLFVLWKCKFPAAYMYFATMAFSSATYDHSCIVEPKDVELSN